MFDIFSWKSDLRSGVIASQTDRQTLWWKISDFNLTSFYHLLLVGQTVEFREHLGILFICILRSEKDLCPKKLSEAWKCKYICIILQENSQLYFPYYTYGAVLRPQEIQPTYDLDLYHHGFILEFRKSCWWSVHTPFTVHISFWWGSHQVALTLLRHIQYPS